jgi:hypothetical protein
LSRWCLEAKNRTRRYFSHEVTPSGDVGNFVWVWDAWSSGRSVCFLRSLDLYFSFGNDVFLFSSLFGSEGAQKHNSICSQIRFWDQHVLQLFFPGIKRVIPHATNQDVDNDGGKIYVYLARNPDKRKRTNRPLANQWMSSVAICAHCSYVRNFGSDEVDRYWHWVSQWT